jgi:tryptophanyl-tRNA synthetase
VDQVNDFKERYVAGKVGDVEVKRALAAAINELLEPFRERRAHYLARPELVREALAAGTAAGKRAAEETMTLVREAIGLDYLAPRSRWWPPSA